MARLPCTHLGAMRLQPGTLAGQGAHHEATAAIPLDTPLVRLAPRPHGMADVPRGLVPHQQPRRFAFHRHPVRPPRQTLCRHRTDRTTVDKAEAHALCVSASQPITRDRFGRWVVAVRRVLDHAEWLGRGPGMAVGLGQAAPPHRLLQPPHPVRMPQCQGHQAIAPLFLRAYCGSGLVIQCVARCQLVASRWRARRRLSSLSTRSGMPCS